MKPLIHNIDQNTEEWMLLRLGKFTASTFKDVMAKPETLTFKKAISRVATEKVTGELVENYSNSWMERGHELEPLAAEEYEMINFSDLETTGFYELNEWIGCSPDRKIKGVNAGVEIKCPAYHTHDEYLEKNKLPAEYKWQVQGQLMITGWDYIDFMSFYPKKKSFIIRVLPDDKLITQLKSKLDEAVELAKKRIELITP